MLGITRRSQLCQESLAKQCADGGMSYAERAAKREEILQKESEITRIFWWKSSIAKLVYNYNYYGLWYL